MTSDRVLTDVFEMLIGRLAGLESSMSDMRAVMQSQDDMMPAHSGIVGALHDAPQFTSVCKNYHGALSGGVIYAVMDRCDGTSSIPRLTGHALLAELGLAFDLSLATADQHVQISTLPIMCEHVIFRPTCVGVGLERESYPGSFTGTGTDTDAQMLTVRTCRHKYLNDEMTERALMRRFPQLVAVGDDGRGVIFYLGPGRHHTLRDALRFLATLDGHLGGGWKDVELYSLGHEDPSSELAKMVAAYVCDSPGEYVMLDQAWRDVTGPTRAVVLAQLRFHHVSHIGDLLDPSDGLLMDMAADADEHTHGVNEDDGQAEPQDV